MLSFVRAQKVYACLLWARDRAFVQTVDTLEPGPYGLLTATITREGKAYLKGVINGEEDRDHPHA